MTTLEEARNFFQDDIFATETTGIELTDVSEGYAKCTLNIASKHLNSANTVMGGAIYTLADFAFAVAANFNRPLTVTLTSQISYLDVPKGNMLIAEAKMLKDGRKTAFFTVEIKDELGNDVASVICNGFRK